LPGRKEPYKVRIKELISGHKKSEMWVSACDLFSGKGGHESENRSRTRTVTAACTQAIIVVWVLDIIIKMLMVMTWSVCLIPSSIRDTDGDNNDARHACC